MSSIIQIYTVGRLVLAFSFSPHLISHPTSHKQEPLATNDTFHMFVSRFVKVLYHTLSPRMYSPDKMVIRKMKSICGRDKEAGHNFGKRFGEKSNCLDRVFKRAFLVKKCCSPREGRCNQGHRARNLKGLVNEV